MKQRLKNSMQAEALTRHAGDHISDAGSAS